MNLSIGLETARQFGARGFTVLAGARDEGLGLAAERQLRADGADARFVSLDVTRDASVRAAAVWIEREYGRLDILVNNAGIARGNLASETDLDTMREVYEVNVFGVIRVTNAMLPLLRRARAARIVNVSSEVGSITSMTDPDSPLAQMPMASLAYPSSKSALNMITAIYAKELRDTPIKINAANPGYTKTDLNHNSGFRSVTADSVRSRRGRKPACTWPPWARTARAASCGVTCGPPTASPTPTPLAVVTLVPLRLSWLRLRRRTRGVGPGRSRLGRGPLGPRRFHDREDFYVLFRIKAFAIMVGAAGARYGVWREGWVLLLV